jgi:hypothetical protein
VRTSLRILCSVLVVVALAPGARAESLRTRLGNASQTVGIAGGSAFNALADVIANTAARSIPNITGSAGFTYRYNEQLDVFERTSDTLGPLFLERPDTLGRNKFNVNLSWTYVEFNQYDGQDLGNLQGSDPIVLRRTAGGQPVGFAANTLQYRIGLQNNVSSLSLTYGILDDLDVNLLVPLISTSFEVGVQSQQVATAGPDGVFSSDVGPALNGRTGGTAFGVGDILLRGKYRLPDLGYMRQALGLQFRLPSGDKANFQGTGDFEVSPAYYVSTVIWGGHVEPYANVAVDANASDVAQSQARYGCGVDFDTIRSLNFNFSFLGRSEFSREAPASDTSFLALAPDGSLVQQPLLGLNFSRQDFFDASIGFRWAVWERLMVFANAIVPLNTSGLRNDTAIPTVGVEGVF